MGKRHFIPVTPAVLRWAIRESGITDESLADGVGVPLSKVHEWAHGDAQPSKTEFQRLVDKLKRPSAVFFLPEPPESHAPRVHFRRPTGSGRSKPTPKELHFLRVTGRVQRVVSWALGELETAQPQLPEIPTTMPVEAAATKIREFLISRDEDKTRITSDAQRQNHWRYRLESRGVFVFFLPLGRDAVRGFSLFDTAAPLIAINTTRWTYRARIFSMLHEFSHLVSRTSSACMDAPRLLPSDGDRVERWCEGVAASVLLPWSDVAGYLATTLSLRRGQQITSLDQLYKVANNFGASARATALLLIDHGIADWSLYAQIPSSKEEKRDGGGGGGRSRAEIREDEYGAKTVRVFARAVSEGLLTSADASGYLRIADPDIQAAL